MRTNLESTMPSTRMKAANSLWFARKSVGKNAEKNATHVSSHECASVIGKAASRNYFFRSPLACHAHNHARTLNCFGFFSTGFRGKERLRLLVRCITEYTLYVMSSALVARTALCQMAYPCILFMHLKDSKG